MSAPVISQYGSGSMFIGCPAVYQVTPTGAGSDKTFYRMKLTVGVGMNSDEKTEFEFSTPIEVNDGSAQNTYFDVSSALRAIADQWQPTPMVPSDYPEINFYMVAEEEWMNDGSIRHSDTSRYPGSGSSASTMRIGTLTDRERLDETPAPPATYSRKPATSPEICFYSPASPGIPDNTVKHLLPGSTTANPAVSPSSVPAGFPSGGTPNIYGIPYPADGYEIRFINSLGVHENIFILCLRKAEVDYTTERYVISRQETLTAFSRGLTKKKNNHERWKMSTPPLDRQWQEWYLHEFLMAEWAWINIGGHYYQIHILPEDTTPGIDRQKSSPLTVEFDIEFDINGSPF